MLESLAIPFQYHRAVAEAVMQPVVAVNRFGQGVFWNRFAEHDKAGPGVQDLLGLLVQVDLQSLNVLWAPKQGTVDIGGRRDLPEEVVQDVLAVSGIDTVALFEFLFKIGCDFPHRIGFGKTQVMSQNDCEKGQAQ